MAEITIDRATQRFDSDPQPEPDVAVIHTTEGMGWPGYNGGGSAPHATIKPLPGKGIEVREHIPFGDFAKALMNLPGGVETNRRGALQFELIGTCDPKHQGDSKWYFWPEADDVVLQALADYLRPLLAQYGIPHRAPAFLPYPKSYGSKSGQRMSGQTWINYQGIVGHQHVPENDHGDPGAFPIARLLEFLGSGPRSETKASRTTARKPAPKTVWGRGDQGDKVREIQRVVGVTVDGIFGPNTETALKRWQRARGLAADGLWGPACEAAKSKPVSKPRVPAGAPAFPGLVRRGSRGDAVRKVQQRLRDRGWNVGVDGIFGGQTEQVVRAFQAEKKLPVDGIVGPVTWRSLWTSPVT